MSIVGIVLFGYDGELFFGSEIVSECAGEDRGNGYPKECEGIERDARSLGNSKIHTVQIASDGMCYSVQIYRPFGRGEVAACVDYGAVDEQISDGGAICEQEVGNVGSNAQPQTVEGTGLETLTVDPYLISCAYIPYVRIYYEKIEQNGKCADSHYYCGALRVLGHGIQEKSEYRKGELIYKKLGYRRGVTFYNMKHSEPFKKY